MDASIQYRFGVTRTLIFGKFLKFTNFGAPLSRGAPTDRGAPCDITGYRYRYPPSKRIFGVLEGGVF